MHYFNTKIEHMPKKATYKLTLHINMKYPAIAKSIDIYMSTSTTRRNKILAQFISNIDIDWLMDTLGDLEPLSHAMLPYCIDKVTIDMNDGTAIVVTKVIKDHILNKIKGKCIVVDNSNGIVEGYIEAVESKISSPDVDTRIAKSDEIDYTISIVTPDNTIVDMKFTYSDPTHQLLYYFSMELMEDVYPEYFAAMGEGG